VDGNWNGNSRKQKLASLLFSVETASFPFWKQNPKAPWKQLSLSLLRELFRAVFPEKRRAIQKGARDLQAGGA